LWDILLLPPVFGVIFLLAWGGQRMAVPYQFGEQLPTDLPPSDLT
jgi:NitT/TauT family transport system permease protein